MDVPDLQVALALYRSDLEEAQASPEHNAGTCRNLQQRIGDLERTLAETLGDREGDTNSTRRGYVFSSDFSENEDSSANEDEEARSV